MVKINWVCFANYSGYAQAALDYILSLHYSGKYDIRMDCFGGKPGRGGVSDSMYKLLTDLSSKEKTQDMIQVYHCVPTIQQRIKPLRKNIGIAVYETYQPPDEWVKILNRDDAVFSPSLFNYKIFAHARLNVPFFHIPHCIDVNLYNDRVEPLEKRDRYTFLFFGSWKQRKGYPQLLEAWFREFSVKDKVQLVIKTDRPEEAAKCIERTKREMGVIHEGNAPVIIEKRVFDEVHLPKFLKSVNCLISPTLGEGFGLPGLQCMSVGIPVIITNFSGVQDYATPETATLMEPDGFVAYKDLDRIPQFFNKKWAFVSIDKICSAMRAAFENPSAMQTKVDNGLRLVHQNFSYEKNVSLFDQMVGVINGEI